MAGKKKAAAPKAVKPVAAPAAGATTYPLETISQLLMLTPQRVNQLERAGWVPKAGRNAYSLVSAVQGYIKFLRDENSRTSKSAAQSRVQDARAREIELRIAREENRVVEVEDVEILVAEIVGAFRSELSGVPAGCTRDLELRRTIETKLNGAIDRCRKRFEEAQRSAWNSSEGAVDGEEAAA